MDDLEIYLRHLDQIEDLEDTPYYFHRMSYGTGYPEAYTTFSEESDEAC